MRPACRSPAPTTIGRPPHLWWGEPHPQRGSDPIDDLVDLDLVEVAHRTPDGTLCLVSALAHHGLTDQIPCAIDIAIPRGRRPRKLGAPVVWHHFARNTFDLGRNTLPLGAGKRIGNYDAERSIVDSFRLRHSEGSDLAVEALRAWLRRPDSRPAALLHMARAFPPAYPALRSALEVLL